MTGRERGKEKERERKGQEEREREGSSKEIKPHSVCVFITL